MKIKNEAQFEAMEKELDHYLNVEGGNDEDKQAVAMYDALAAYVEWEELMEYRADQLRFGEITLDEFFDSERDEQPHTSDADSGL